MPLDERRKLYLKAMGIPVWEARDDRFAHLESQYVESVPEIMEPEHAPAARVSLPVEVDWSGLQREVAACTRCDLHMTRNHTVFGVGNEHADLLLIGEAPGAEEDQQGEPFVGPAGKLLDAMLMAMGFQREQVFIANTVKCMPPGDRKPEAEEIKQCADYLQRQIAYIKPKLILSVGAVSAQHLLNTNEKISKLRGQVFHYGAQQIPLIATFHPAYLLRSPLKKRLSWSDLQLALKVLRGELH